MAWSPMGSEEESFLALCLLMAAEEEKDNRDRRRRRLWSRRLLLERPLRGERAVLMEFEKFWKWKLRMKKGCTCAGRCCCLVETGVTHVE